MAALRRFNDALLSLTADNWEAKLAPVFNELTFNLESFNPAFTSVLLKVQSSIGTSDYVRRDNALKHLIVPLAGEYGMHNGEAQCRAKGWEQGLGRRVWGPRVEGARRQGVRGWG